MTVTELRSKMPLKEYNQWIGLYTMENEERNKQIAMAEAQRINVGKNADIAINIITKGVSRAKIL